MTDADAQWPSGLAIQPGQRRSRLLTINMGLLGFRFAENWRLSLAPQMRERSQAAPSFIRRVGADVVLIQEIFSRRDRRDLSDALADLYPFHAASLGQAALLGSGLMVLSRYPLSAVAFVAIAARFPFARWIASRDFLVCAVDLPGLGAVVVINLHLTAHEGAGAFDRRKAEIKQLLRLAAMVGKPTLLIGDFNCSPSIVPELYALITEAGYRDAYAAGRDATTAEAGVT